MRRLLAALLIAGLFVVPAGPAAAAEPAPTQMCAVTLELPLLLLGDSVTVGQCLMSDGRPVSGQSVELWEAPLRGGEYSYLATAITDAAGHVAAVVTPTRDTIYEWRFAGTAEYAATLGSGKGYAVGWRVRLRQPRVAGRGVRVGGKVMGRSPGKVRISASAGKGPLKRLGTASVDARGRYRTTFKLAPGRYRIQVTVAPRPGLTGTIPAQRRIRVSG